MSNAPASLTGTRTSLTGKVSLVIGDSRSIGAAIALTYSASPEKAAEVVKAIEAADGRAFAEILADGGFTA